MRGERLGGFEVIEEIGRGGMGIVYLARQVSLDRKAALKTISHAGYSEPAAVERFQIEARAASRITHPNLTQIYDVGVEGDTHFMAMELVEGRSLLAMVAEEGALDPRQTAGIARQVALGLDALHKAGIVHRDVKPGNIIVRPDGVAKITDFGLALLKESSRRLTEDGRTVGTVDYISPEQVRGEEVDGRSDIYSLGIVMYRMLAGTVPFSGNTAAVLHMQVETEAEDLRLVVPGLPETLGAVVMRCLAKDPDDRFQTAESLAAHLEDIQMQMRFLTIHERTVITPQRRTPPPLPAPRAGILDRTADSLAGLFSPEARRSRALLRTAAQAEQTLLGLAQLRDRQSELARKVQDLKGPEHSAEASAAPMAEVARKPAERPGEDVAVLESELGTVLEEARELEAEYARLQSKRGELLALSEQQSARAIRSPEGRLWGRRAVAALGVAVVAGVAAVATLAFRPEPPSQPPPLPPAPPPPQPRQVGPFAVGKGPRGIIAGDLNADGSPDLACVCRLSECVSVLYGKGDGTFGESEPYGTGAFDWGPLMEDFDRDGLADVAVVGTVETAEGPEPAVSVLYGAAAEGARPQRFFAIGQVGPPLAGADLNGDGAVDLVAGNLSVLLGTGDGGFQPHRDFGFDAAVMSAATGDLDGDGYLDIGAVLPTENSVEVLYGSPDGQFSRRKAYPAWDLPHGLSAADVDGDGVTDLAFTSQFEATVSILWMPGRTEDAPVHQRICRDLTTPLLAPTALSVADVDRNGLADLVVLDPPAFQLVVALQRRPREFESISFRVAPGTFGIVVADLDGNGYPDVATTQGLEGGQVNVLLNPGYAGTPPSGQAAPGEGREEPGPDRP